MDAAGPDPGSFAQERFSRGCCRSAGMWRPVDRGDRVPAVRAAPGQVIVTMPFDGDQGDHKSAVLTLLAEEPAEPDDRPALVGRLQRLCRAAERDLPACGVGVSWVSESGGLITAAASSQDSIRLEELQFTMGEGPCLAAVASRSPVLVPDLGEAANATWLGYGPAAHEHGVRAVFAFPLQVGAARLGAMDVYRDEVGGLSSWALSRALSYADVAVETMLKAHGDAGGPGSLWSQGDDTRFEVYQAQGMVMVQLGVGPDEALSRLRAYAFAHDRRLREVANDVIGRSVELEPDDPHQ
jgi:ANTAR domain/GAF domain